MLPTLSLLSGGCHPAPTLREADLTNYGRGKYWDEVYSIDIYGRLNGSYPTRYGQPHLSYRCDYFGAKGQVVHYLNTDSITVVDRGSNSDVRYNPDQFQLCDSTLIYWHDTLKVVALTPKLLVLEHEFDHKKALRIYVPSRYQQKRVQLVE
ncbi:hypothetical protein [Hymenobacter sp. BT559]|uniref:hypothetical protein n=1 Tax=Hymenobacter sp. BT559 TaxID=2795729 RepID=UPI0018EA9281|nr:hypothetical protein [Hymenobacter sp. BT559]MBJ6146426.1 hypothetical protein [Hymenobacter sp. BT559]